MDERSQTFNSSRDHGLCVSSKDFVAWIRHHHIPSAWQLICFSSSPPPTLHLTQTRSKVGRGLKEVPQVISAVRKYTNLPRFNNGCFFITCCACEKLHFLAESLPTTELNYESLANIWKYIIKRLHNNLFLAVCVYVCNLQVLVYWICKWSLFTLPVFLLTFNFCINEYECGRPSVA